MQLVALTTLAFVQPLVSMLAENPEFFSAHKVGGSQLLGFVAVITLVPPAMLFLSVFVVNKLSYLARTILFISYTVILSFLIFLPLLGKIEFLSASAPLAISVIFSILVGFYYFKSQLFRASLAQISIIAIIIPLVFFLNPNIQELILPDAETSVLTSSSAAKTSVIMVVFDEFSLSSIMDAEHNIDAVLYPNLAWFAERSHWFRNATSVADRTTNALPAILAGKYAKGVLPTYQNYPKNLFTILQSSHALNVHESATQLCSPTICEEFDRQKTSAEKLALVITDSLVLYLHVVVPEQFTDVLPDISHGWTNFLSGSSDDFQSQDVQKKPADRNWLLARIHKYLADDRADLWDRFLNRISNSSQPSLSFLHILLPHVAYEYLADGTNYGRQVIPGLKKEKWSEDDWATTQAWQRYLMQLGYVDKLLGKLFSTLKANNAFEESLIVITADHGVSFRSGDYRRPISNTNYMDILPVPLFIKLPGQIQGKLSDLNIEIVDILPTILEQLNITLQEDLEGFSVFNEKRIRSRNHKSMFTLAGGEQTIHYESDFLEKYVLVDKRIELFGENSDPEKLFAVGPDKNLISKPIENLPFGDLHINRIETKGNVTRNPYEQYTGPNFVSGFVSGSWSGELPIRLAIAVNGIVTAVTKTYSEQKKGIHEFSFIVPKSAYGKTINRIEIFSVQGKPKNETRLGRFQFDGAMEYALVSDGEEGIAIENSFKSRYRIEDGKLKGYLDIIDRSKNGYVFRGWAVDQKNGKPAQDMVLFAEGKFIASVIPRSKRSDVATAFGEEGYTYSGYTLAVDGLSVKQICSKNFELYALSEDGVASKIKISKKSLVQKGSPDC